MKYNRTLPVKGIKRLLFAGFLATALLRPLSGAETVPYQSDPRLSRLAEPAEPLPPAQLAETFLVASGTEESRIPAYLLRLEDLAAKLSLYMERSGEEDAAPGERILQFMHQESLRSYRLTQTRLDTLLDTGYYNCVSSAVLYMYLTRSQGLFAYGIHTADHAFCAVDGGGESRDVDVETTNLWGYDPGVKKEFHSEFSNQTGFAYVPPGEYALRKKIGDKEMAGLILHNRIVEEQGRRRFDTALSLAADRLALTRSEMGLEGYFDSVQNLAAEQNRLGLYEEGIRTILAAEEGPYELPASLKETRYQIVYNLCGSILNRGDTDRAEEVLTRYRALLPESLLQELTFLIEEKKLDGLLRRGYSPETVEQIFSSLERGILTAKRAEEMLIYLYASQAERLSAGEDYLKGLLFLEGAAMPPGESREFRRLLSVYRQNYAVTLHNQVVPLFNARRWEEAEKRLREGLERVPGNTLLQGDLDKLERMR